MTDDLTAMVPLALYRNATARGDFHAAAAFAAQSEHARTAEMLKDAYRQIDELKKEIARLAAIVDRTPLEFRK